MFVTLEASVRMNGVKVEYIYKTIQNILARKEKKFYKGHLFARMIVLESLRTIFQQYASFSLLSV